MDAFLTVTVALIALIAVFAAEAPRLTDPQNSLASQIRQQPFSVVLLDEFVNRLDRVLCFRLLSRETMRAILSAQLRKATTRRGLRQRPWSLDLDSSATEVL